MRTKTSKVEKIRKLLAEGKSVKEIAKKVGVPANYVYSTRWHMKKDKAAPKKATKKAVKQLSLAADLLERRAKDEADLVKKTENHWKVYAAPEQQELPLSTPNPLDMQVGGTHYKYMDIQPIQYIVANDLNFLEGCIVKRISRWRDKGDKGIEDLEKIKHEVDLLIAAEKDGLQSVTIRG